MYYLSIICFVKDFDGFILQRHVKDIILFRKSNKFQNLFFHNTFCQTKVLNANFYLIILFSKMYYVDQK